MPRGLDSEKYLQAIETIPLLGIASVHRLVLSFERSGEVTTRSSYAFI